jgi:hypothetical protein
VLVWGLILPLLFNLASSTQTFPQRRSAGTPNPVDIVERYIAAIGGRTNWSSLSSKITRGSIQLPEARTSGTIEIYEKSPNRLLVKAFIRGVGSYRTGFDGTQGWRREVDGTVRRLAGAELARIKRDADLIRETRILQNCSTLRYKRTERLNSGEAHVLTCIPSEDPALPRTMYFDVKSGFKVREDFVYVRDSEKIPVSALLSHYRQVQNTGILVPHVIAETTSKGTQIVRVEQVTVNSAVDLAMFNASAE